MKYYILPSVRILGGVTSNFVYNYNMLGNDLVIVSLVGNDELDLNIKTELLQNKISARCIKKLNDKSK